MPKDVGYYHNESGKPGRKHKTPKQMKAAQKASNPFAKAAQAAKKGK